MDDRSLDPNLLLYRWPQGKRAYLKSDVLSKWHLKFCLYLYSVLCGWLPTFPNNFLGQGSLLGPQTFGQKFDTFYWFYPIQK